MPASRITYTDEEGNRKVYIGNPRHFKIPKGTKDFKKPKGTKAPGTPPKKKGFRDTPYPQFSQEFKPRIKEKAFKGGGMAGMRRFNRGGKV
jgi:hypothetical protein